VAADNQPSWQKGVVVEAAPVARDVQRIVLQPERPQHARAGSHVDVRLQLDAHPDDRTVTRSYSVVRSEDEGRRLTLSVQLAPASRGGSRLMHALSEGDRIEMTQPLQNFPLGVGSARYVLVAGGIGITALMAMGSVLRERGADYDFVYVGRTRTVMPYLDQLAEEHGERFHLHVDDEGTPLDVEEVVGGVAQHDAAARTEMYVCGPIRLMDALRRSWIDHGLSAPSLRFETFGNSGAWAAEDFVVRIPRLDREVRVDANQSMLDALEDSGIDVMWDCRKGECGLCTVKVLDVSGHVDHRDVFLDDGQKAASSTLCCCVSRVARGEQAAVELRDTTADSTPATAATTTRPAQPDVAGQGPAVLTIDLP
jgi:vanillate O-demethylase ferredoxin subunit